MGQLAAARIMKNMFILQQQVKTLYLQYVKKGEQRVRLGKEDIGQ